MKNKHRKKAGELAIDILKHAQENDHTPFEQMQSMLHNYEENLLIAIYGCKKILHPLDAHDKNCHLREHQLGGMYMFDGDFFVTVITKKDPLLKNVITNFFIPQSSCPSPTYDQSVFKFYRRRQDLEHQWTLPSKDTYEMMRTSVLQIPEDQRELLQHVLDDCDGTLLRRCKELNGEDINSKYDKVLIINSEEGHA